MKKLIHFLVFSFALILFTSCQKNLTDMESPQLAPNARSSNATITQSGALLWYKHLGYQNGTSSWAGNGSGTQVGSGWANFKSVFATNNGVLYGIETDSKLMWYRHLDYLNGTSSWANSGIGKQVGSGWAGFKAVFATSSGVIYGIQPDGKLMWYRHIDYLNGTSSWANGGIGKQVGSGWAGFKAVFATSSGVIYGIQPDGKLMSYRHLDYLNGTSSWANGGIGKQVGSGWANFKSVFATNEGVLYGIQPDGRLIWYKHLGYLSGTSSWANGGAGIQVGSGWANFKSVFATSGGVIYGINP